MTKLPPSLKIHLKEMVEEMKADFIKMRTLDLSPLSNKLCKEKIRYYTYLHNANIPMAKASLIKIDEIWQEIHYEVTFETEDTNHICMVIENTNSIEVKDDNMFINKFGGEFKNTVTDKDNENSLMMGERMVMEKKELAKLLSTVLEVLTMVEKQPRIMNW